MYARWTPQALQGRTCHMRSAKANSRNEYTRLFPDRTGLARIAQAVAVRLVPHFPKVAARTKHAVQPRHTLLKALLRYSVDQVVLVYARFWLPTPVIPVAEPWHCPCSGATMTQILLIPSAV